jgi:hypothetical protein
MTILQLQKSGGRTMRERLSANCGWYASDNRQFFLEVHNLFDLDRKPAVNLREIENLFVVAD